MQFSHRIFKQGIIRLVAHWQSSFFQKKPKKIITVHCYPSELSQGPSMQINCPFNIMFAHRQSLRLKNSKSELAFYALSITITKPKKE